MAEFSQLVKERRSASNFLPDHPIAKDELNEMFELVALAPSAFNLQHTKYVTVLDPDVKEKLKQAANGQYKVLAHLRFFWYLEISRHISKRLASMKG